MQPASVPNGTTATPLPPGRALPAIRAAIAAAGGWIPFSRYMEIALYAPEVGYYTGSGAKFGAAGDFVTASGISGLFGAALAHQVGEICARSDNAVLEFGAGTGALAADLLNAAGEAIASYAVLELSPDLRQRQQATLAARAPQHLERVRWLDRLPVRFSGCIVANEVLDAMPVELLHWSAAGIRARGVACAGDALRLVDRPVEGGLVAAAATLAATHAIEPPYVSELGLAARAWIATLGAMLDRGAVLVVDYGFPAREYYHPQRAAGTLMCHRHHQAIADPLASPGDADLTAHVDFTAIAEAALDAGLEVLGYANQAAFLIDCGILDHLAAAQAGGEAAYLQLANQANRLLSPAEMGELFKVLALGRGIGDGLLGFARGDRRHTL